MEKYTFKDGLITGLGIGVIVGFTIAVLIIR